MVKHVCEYPGCDEDGDSENFDMKMIPDTAVNVADVGEPDDYVGRGNWYCREHFDMLKKEMEN